MILSAGTFFSTAFTVVPINTNIPLASGERIVGNGILLANPTDILIATPGIYLISYYFQGDPVGDIETIACSLRLNGVTVPGSIVQSVTSLFSEEVEPSVSNTCVVQTTVADTVLQLHNSSNSEITHVRWVDGFCSASVTVLRLS